MDKEKMVKQRIDETRKLIACLAEDQQFIVSDAFWMESLEDDAWTLHLVSPAIDQIGIPGGYGVLTLALRAHPEIELDTDDIRPQRTNNPVVLEALDFMRRYPASEAFLLGGVYLKGHFVQRAYLYPVLLDGKAGSENRSVSLITS